MTNQTITPALREAASILAGLDPDHAQFANGVGYSAGDGPFGHALALLPASQWSSETTHAAWEMLRKYRGQLESAGIDFDSIPEPPNTDSPVEVYSSYGSSQSTKGRRDALAAAKTLKAQVKLESSKCISLVDGDIDIAFAYDAKLVELVRAIPGRRWNAATKSNRFPASSARAVMEFGDAHGFPYSLEVAKLAVATPITPAAAPKPNVSLRGNHVVVTFDYDANLVSTLKASVTKGEIRWSPDTKEWIGVLDALPKIVAWADKYDLMVTPEALERVETVEAEFTEQIEASKALDADIEVPGLAPGIELMPFQRAGVAYAIKTRRALIADEMGLGKTIQGLAAVVAGAALPTIVVVPNVAKGTWPREIARFFPALTVNVVSGTTPEELPQADVTVVNYDIVEQRAEDLLALEPMSLIADELHYCKNGSRKAVCPECGEKCKSNSKKCTHGHQFAAPTIRYTVRRTDGVARIARGIPADGMVVGLTGTPVLNKPVELINQLEILGTLADFGGEWAFKKRYCGAYQGKWGWVFDGATHTAELHEKLRAKVMVRRTKKEVLPELPEARYAPVYLEPSWESMTEYRRIEADVIEFLAQRARELALEAGENPDDAYWEKKLKAQAAEHLVKVGVLMRAAANARFQQGVEWVESFLEETETEKIILFATQIDLVEKLAAHFGTKAVKVRGGVTLEQRDAAVARFMSDSSCRVFIGNLAAAKENLTLTSASNVAFFEQDWTPANHDQAIARCYGRVNDPHGATGYFFLAEGTFDVSLFNLLNRKRGVVDAVTDGKEMVKKEVQVVGDLLVELAKAGMKVKV